MSFRWHFQSDSNIPNLLANNHKKSLKNQSKYTNNSGGYLKETHTQIDIEIDVCCVKQCYTYRLHFVAWLIMWFIGKTDLTLCVQAHCCYAYAQTYIYILQMKTFELSHVIRNICYVTWKYFYACFNLEKTWTVKSSETHAVRNRWRRQMSNRFTVKSHCQDMCAPAYHQFVWCVDCVWVWVCVCVY